MSLLNRRLLRGVHRFLICPAGWCGMGDGASGMGKSLSQGSDKSRRNSGCKLFMVFGSSMDQVVDASLAPDWTADPGRRALPVGGRRLGRRDGSAVHRYVAVDR